MKKIFNNKQKLKFFIAGLALVLVASLGFFVQSCSQEDDPINSSNPSEQLSPGEFEYCGKIIKCEIGESIWEKQFSLAMQNSDQMNKNDLILESYKYIGKINSIEELEQIKMDIITDAVFPKYTSSNEFEIVKQTEVFSPTDMKEILDKLMPTSESNFKLQKNSLQKSLSVFFEIGDISTVEVNWIYKGNKLKTIALVSNKHGIIYDNLLFFIHDTEEKTEMHIQTIPRLKSDSEVPVSVAFHYGTSGSAYNKDGQELYYFMIECIVYGIKNGNIVSISKGEVSEVHRSAYPWSCDAKVQEVSSVAGVNGHYTFAYAYDYKLGGTVSISWQGFGFSILGGSSNGASGTMTVIPDDLNY